MIERTRLRSGVEDACGWKILVWVRNVQKWNLGMMMKG